jgi:hypothetical protein
MLTTFPQAFLLSVLFINYYANRCYAACPARSGIMFVSIGSEVLTAVVVKSHIFLDIKPCSPLKIKPTFRRNMSPPISGSKNTPSEELA